jgi:hypothetical protein
MPALSYDKRSKGAQAYLALAGELVRKYRKTTLGDTKSLKQATVMGSVDPAVTGELAKGMSEASTQL